MQRIVFRRPPRPSLVLAGLGPPYRRCDALPEPRRVNVSTVDVRYVK